ncbi:hypothetical protein QNH46_21165 [Paenibacillus woosongensis]|uniref:Alpha/beta hydrolase n=1 Tax=Paenibacillus woosongensis TaxID=307580 RepID=A0AA95KT78_9BACL|nr:hypothetical protein [Paenibacillus woosongensis]WHX48548.1 hypothetical protein QNH46_21165 [Paenibacillus woosongensis]
MNSVISKDGTKIAYEKQGTGPTLILVSSAAADHHDAAQLAEQLAAHFTVYNYDRRGRGHSTVMRHMPFSEKWKISRHWFKSQAAKPACSEVRPARY